MSGLSLHIDRVRSRYRVSSEEDAVGARARLDTARDIVLSSALERALPGVLSTLGLDPSAEIAVRRLSVRLRVRGAAAEAAIAEAWTQAITEALVTSLTPLVRLGGGVTEDAVVFADRFEAERAYLVERSLGEAGAWWWRPILGRGGGGAPSPRSVLSGWIDAIPERAPGAIAALAVETGGALARLLSEGDAAALAAEVQVSRVARLRALREAMAATRMGAALHDEERAPALRDGDAWIDLDAATLRQILDPMAARAIAEARAPAARRFLTLCFVLDRRPAALTLPPVRPPAPRDAEPARPSAAPSSPPDAAASTAPDEARHQLAPDGPAGARDDAPVHAREAGATLARSTSAPRRGPDEDAHEHRIGCGGLLFLVRRVAASTLLDHHRGSALEERLVALGLTALQRALAVLPEGARRAALERERPLLAVFAGAGALPDALHEPLAGAAPREAAEVLDALASALPADLEPCRDGVLATYGPEIAPFPPGHPHRPLAHLLLRAGRLRVTPTRADLHLPARAADVTLRMGGWDIDPGFVPYLGRILRFHYEER